MNEFLNLLVNNLSQIIISGVVALAGYLLTMIGNKAKKVLDDKRIANIVDNAVKCVNQAYETLTNEEKFNKAKKDIINWLNTEGLKTTEAQLKILIESAVAKNKVK